MAAQQRMITLHGSTRDYAHTWATYLVEDGLEMREVSASDLGKPSLHDPRELFRAANDYAEKNGFVGAYPTFIATGRGYSAKHRIAMLSDTIAESVEIPEDEIHELYNHGLSHFFGQFHTKAHEQQPRCTTGFPSCIARSKNGRTIHKAIFIKPFVGVHTRCFMRDIGFPAPEDIAGNIRAIQEFAVKRGFAVATFTGWSQYPESEVFHNFHHAMGVRHMVEHEGWKVDRISQFPPQTDGEGHVHYVATFVLTKNE